MIKLTTFYLFSNFLRVTQEFYEDKAIVKMKSIKAERVFEFKYKEVAKISDAITGSNDMASPSFWLLLCNSIFLSWFHNWIYTHLIWLQISQIVFIIGFLLLIFSFKRNHYTTFVDKNGYALTSIKQNSKKQEVIAKIIETITSTSNKIESISVDNPFPKTNFIFEYIYIDINNLQRITERFYQDKIIGVQKSISGEKSAYIINYNTLIYKIEKWESNNNFFETSLSICLLIFSILSGLYFGFGITYGVVSMLHITYTIIGILIVSLIIKYVIKLEGFSIYHKNGNIGYWAYVNKNEKEKVEKIIEYVKSRIPEENKE